MPRTIWWLLLAVSLLVSPAWTRQGSPFSALVRSHFEQWDLNHDGTISADELDQLMRDPSVHGPEAATLATLKQQSRKTKKRDPWLASEDSLAAYENSLATGATPARRLDQAYRTMLGRLEHASQELYAPGAPHLAAIRQASGGDCYFLSVIIGMLARNPEDVRRLIQPQGDGSFEVRFPGRPPHHLEAPTEAETALYTDDRGDGYWLYLVLMAFGEERMKGNQRFQEVEDPGDVTDTGGSVPWAMQVLTGRKATSTRIGPLGNSRQQSRLRQILSQAFRARRLVALGTGKPSPQRDPMPKGIITGHAMAVLGYDSLQDTVTIRNPWGNTLKPKSPNPVDGFPTEDGLFQLRVPDVCRYFAGVIVEQ